MRQSTIAAVSTSGARFTRTRLKASGQFQARYARTYQHCGEAHLHRYLAEFDFRYNRRAKLGIPMENVRPMQSVARKANASCIVNLVKPRANRQLARKLSRMRMKKPRTKVRPFSTSIL